METAPGRTTRLTRFITDQIDCLINVPNIKDHGGAGITRINWIKAFKQG